MDTMATTGRDAAKLLTIDLDQLARPGAFIAADQLPGRPVHPGQPVQTSHVLVSQAAMLLRWPQARCSL